MGEGLSLFFYDPNLLRLNLGQSPLELRTAFSQLLAVLHLLHSQISEILALFPHNLDRCLLDGRVRSLQFHICSLHLIFLDL